MASILGVSELKINHRIKFWGLIGDNHVYKNVWNPYKVEKPAAVLDDTEETLEYYKYVIGIYKRKGNDCDKFGGHAPA